MKTRAHERFLKAGECLFHEGESGTALYIIECGEMEIVTGENGHDGQERRVLNVLGPGSLLGELAVVDRRPRSATAIARNDAVVTVISPDTVRTRLAGADPVHWRVFSAMAQHFRAETRRTGDASTAPFLPPGSSAEADMDDVLDELRMAAELEHAAGRGELRLLYQPIVALPDAEVLGFEALLRWNSASRGPVPPSRFIPVAEAADCILPIGRWCADQAVQALAQLRPVAAGSLYMSINIAARQIADDQFLDAVTAGLRHQGIDVGDLHLEIVERTLLDERAAGDWLLRCRALGLSVALDDFGTGYSSLQYLSRYPIDTLKIDRSFVSDICQEPKSANICRAVIELGKVLGMQVVAEGIENPGQARLLTEMGCTQGQGWLYHRPMPLDEALTLVTPAGCSMPI